MATKTSLSYGQRAQRHPNGLARRLFTIAQSKQTNITVSADLTTTAELLSIAEGRISFRTMLSMSSMSTSPRRNHVRYPEPLSTGQPQLTLGLVE